MNKVILIGRTTKEIELRRTSGGTAVVSFTLAVENRYVQKEDGKSTADFINCVAWSNVAEIMEKYVFKGMLIAVEGRIQNRNYENKEGRTIYITEVVCENMKMLEYKSAAGRNSVTNLEEYEPNKIKKEEFSEDTTDQINNDEFEISDDELPF